jgi:hypothetical protein
VTLRRNTLRFSVTLPKGASYVRVVPPRAPGYAPGASRIVRIVR